MLKLAEPDSPRPSRCEGATKPSKCITWPERGNTEALFSISGSGVTTSANERTTILRQSERKNMIGAYITVAVRFGIAISYIGLIHYSGCATSHEALHPLGR